MWLSKLANSFAKINHFQLFSNKAGSVKYACAVVIPGEQAKLTNAENYP